MRYSLGLDIGITSAGWAVINLDKHRIEQLGVRAFTAAEIPKTGEPLAKPRREARSARRRLRRRGGRMQRARDLFVKHGLLSKDSLETAFLTTENKPDPWELRAKGLDSLLTPEEFARALYHIVKRRGFKSNRKHEQKSEDGKMLTAIESNKQMLKDSGYRTIGEMLFKDPRFAEQKRNKGDSYINTVDRAMLADEIRTLFESQRRLGSKFASADFENQLIEIFEWQLPFASGDDILRKVGFCTFIKEERRAPKAAYTRERYVLLSKINTITVSTSDYGYRPLTQEERQEAVQLAYKQKEIKYNQLKKKLNLPEETRFKGLTYSTRNKKKDVMDCENATAFELKGYHAFKKAFSAAGLWKEIKDNTDLLDDLAFALTFYKTDEDIQSWLTERGIDESIIQCALTVPGFSEVGDLSIKAMQRMIPYLEQGDVYSVACEKAGFNHYDPGGAVERGLKLPPIEADEIRNPVVLRALSQARKVINAIVREWGPPETVHIELARDMSKTFQERRDNENRIKENEKAKKEADEQFREEFHCEPTGETRIKLLLYREQECQCAYSQKAFDLNRLFEPGYAEIDHILPYSRSLDNSLANRVLVHTEENRNKQNRTPHEYFGADANRWAAFEAWVKAKIKNYKKREHLLKKNFAKEEEEWKERNLNDTRWITRYLSNFVRRHLQFANPDVKVPVVCFSGQVTALVRGLWGLEKNRGENDLHHALDAAVAAVLTPGRIKVITEYRKAQELGQVTEVVDEETGEKYKVSYGRRFFFPEPWKGFRKELLARLSDDPASQIAAMGLPSYKEDPPDLKPLLVSRMPIRKMGGSIHKETIRSCKEVDGKRVAVSRIKLVDLKNTHLDKLYAPETNKELYAAIRERMAQFNDDGKKAFAEEFRKPTKSGKPGPIVRRVKIVDNQPSGIEVREGIADNGNMVRTDVFRKDQKYYLVPVYTSDFIAGVLPNRAIAAHKSEEDWIEMDETYEFQFSLYPYDLVRIIRKTDEFLGYYRSTHRSNGSLMLTPPNKNDLSEEKSIGVKSAVLVEKCHVSVLGEVTTVTGEKRLGMANGGGCQSCEAAD